MKNDDDLRKNINEDDDTTEPEDMEEWMNIWQEDMGTPGDLQALREVFASGQWRRRIKDIIAVVLLLLGVIFCITVLMAPAFTSEFVLAGFVLLVSSGFIWKRYHRMRQERSALPLSPADYLEASKHNLSLLERDNRFLRWVSPIVLPGILLATVWVFIEAWALYTVLSVVLIVAAMIVLLGHSVWEIYVKKPRDLRAERQALEALEQELNS